MCSFIYEVNVRTDNKCFIIALEEGKFSTVILYILVVEICLCIQLTYIRRERD